MVPRDDVPSNDDEHAREGEPDERLGLYASVASLFDDRASARHIIPHGASQLASLFDKCGARAAPSSPPRFAVRPP